MEVKKNIRQLILSSNPTREMKQIITSYFLQVVRGNGVPRRALSLC